MLLYKQDFINFIKALLKNGICPFSDTEIGDLFLFFCKKLDPNPNHGDSLNAKKDPKA